MFDTLLLQIPMRNTHNLLKYTAAAHAAPPQGSSSSGSAFAQQMMAAQLSMMQQMQFCLKHAGGGPRGEPEIQYMQRPHPSAEHAGEAEAATLPQLEYAAPPTSKFPAPAALQDAAAKPELDDTAAPASMFPAPAEAGVFDRVRKRIEQAESRRTVDRATTAALKRPAAAAAPGGKVLKRPACAAPVAGRPPCPPEGSDAVTIMQGRANEKANTHQQL